MFNVILVMKRDTLQEIVPRIRTPSTIIKYNMLTLPKRMNQQTKYAKKEKYDSNEAYVPISALMGTI